jgi:cellobionic acid phosphorylase
VEAAYETTACIMQYRIKLKPGETKEINLLFGPANNKEEIKRMKDKYLQKGSFDRVVSQYDHFYHENSGCIQIATKDETLNHFINYWLPRQILYHAYSLRMVTDPQTRNHIQDAMGMVYVMPEKAKQLYNIALKQQKISGEMPDGILLVEGAEFKYTNQIPHRDHSVWWTYAVSEYMEESGDYGYLEEKLGFSDSDEILSVYEHVCRGIEWLIYDRTEGGFCHIGQGDWNDPMNMVGHKGKGESIWLTQAMTYAMRIWLPFCEEKGDGARVEKFSKIMKETNELLNTEAWDGRWYSRGVTDDGNKMGVSTDEEGQIFLNAQSFGILTGAVDRERMETIIKAVDEKLGTPFGLELLAPSYTHMREDVGRITLKHPGTAENGSVYCHANTFYTYALLEYGYGQRAYEILRSLIPGPDGEDLKKREHLPLYLPNYYRGDHNPRTAGKASHLMNTGSLPWFYRSFIEGIFGLKGCKEGLRIEPQLPKEYDRMTLVRRFRGKILNVEYVRKENTGEIKIILNGAERADNLLPEDELEHVNTLQIQLPL